MTRGHAGNAKRHEIEDAMPSGIVSLVLYLIGTLFFLSGTILAIWEKLR